VNTVSPISENPNSSSLSNLQSKTKQFSSKDSQIQQNSLSELVHANEKAKLSKSNSQNLLVSNISSQMEHNIPQSQPSFVYSQPNLNNNISNKNQEETQYQSDKSKIKNIIISIK
jgi:hypothetical protein